MRFSKLYSLLIVLAGTVASAGPFKLTQDTLSALRGMAAPQFKLAVNKESFDLKIALMKTQMESMNSIAARVELLKKTLDDIQESRDKKPMLEDDVELYMDIFTQSLRSLPSGDKFDKKYCNFYQVKLLSNYEPTALDENGAVGNPVDPAVIEAISVVNKICE